MKKQGRWGLWSLSTKGWLSDTVYEDVLSFGSLLELPEPKVKPVRFPTKQEAERFLRTLVNPKLYEPRRIS